MRRTLLRALAVWWVILVLAFANGALREIVLIPAWGPLTGLRVSGVLLSALIVALAWVSMQWIGVKSAGQALMVGAMWLVATLAFEFGFGAGVQHKSIDEMLVAYTLKDGNLWPVVLLVCLLAPVGVFGVRRASSAKIHG